MRVTYFFDCISPYSCLGWSVLKRYKAAWGLELELVPMFLGGVMKATGNQPPATLPAKAVAMASDLKRNVAFFDVPILDTPNNFFSSAAREILQCQRLIVAAQLHKLDADAVSRLVDSCTTSVHLDAKCRTEDNDLHAIDDKFLAACCKRAGLDDAVAKVLLDLRGSAEVKAQLQSNTERAVEAGAYGSPTMIFHSPTPNATGESDIMIFGSDRFEQAAFLIGKPWYGPRGPPSSAKL